jgi:hypothetical protein
VYFGRYRLTAEDIAPAILEGVMTDNERKTDEDLQRAAEEFFAAKVSQGYTPEHATAMLYQRFHQVREAIRRKALHVVDET